jgi:nucleoside phosphorylase
MTQHHLRREDYKVGWVAALPIEFAAAEMLLDENHGRDADEFSTYTLGRIGEHNVVLGCLPAGQTGTNTMTRAAAQMMARYSSIQMGLTVGIGGGVPSSEADVRLGDVVISQPHMEHPGVIQYDFGKATTMGFVRTGSLSPPPPILLNALARLQANRFINKSSLSTYLATLSSASVFRRDEAAPDLLFQPNYTHVGGRTCDGCDGKNVVNRPSRGNQEIVIHYGTIASGNQVIEDAVTRDELSSKFGGVLCFEMEAAGLMNTFKCLVIRGICSYADSHKNDTWQPYAAATAAACGKEILNIIPGNAVKKMPSTSESNSGQESDLSEINHILCETRE